MDIFKKLQSYMDYSFGKTKEKIEIIYEDTFFERLVFTGYDLNNTEFLEVVFNECDFTDVYLSGSNLCGSTFRQCIFNNNIFRKGKADYTLFDQTDFRNIDSFRTSFYKARFVNLVMEDSKMDNCLIVGASFLNVVLKNVNLVNTSFRRSKFENVKFIKCVFDKTTFEGVSGIESVEFIDN